MLRIFLVEDEGMLRATLRDTVPWEQCGYEFVGEAADGELALPLIRKAKPDVLITDIRMPFMDGLALSRIALSEFPQLKIIILSGYDDFGYAQEAIEIGVEQYLLKPVTKHDLTEVLRNLREKIERERAQSHSLAQLHLEAEEYAQYARRRFFEKMLAGRLSPSQIYEEAEKLDLDLRAESYAIAFFSIPKEAPEPGAHPDIQGIQEALLAQFQSHPAYILLRWSLDVYAVLIKAEEAHIEAHIERCIEAVRTQYARHCPDANWHVAVSSPSPRLSALPACFEELSRLWSYRHVHPEAHVLTAATVHFPEPEEANLDASASAKERHSIREQAVRYIDQHYTDPELSLNQIARQVNISPNYLSAVFSQEMDCTLKEYITNKRMERARELLRNTDMRSGEIAFAIGYKDPHYFSFFFKKTQGMSPREYRAGRERT